MFAFGKGPSLINTYNNGEEPTHAQQDAVVMNHSPENKETTNESWIVIINEISLQ